VIGLVATITTAEVWVFAQIQPTALDIERIRSATVFVLQARSQADNLVITCVGSGTIVSRSGLILTNAHNVVPSSDCPGDTLLIARTLRSDEPPVPEFRAEITQADIGLDLALLRVTRQLDGSLIAPDSLALPFVELGDSSVVELDDTIVVVGYPGLGDDSVLVESGIVSGFMQELSASDRSWIKTSASIRGTMSGGGAYDRESRLIGIPTTAPVTNPTFGTSCEIVQDGNGDGAVNNKDVCIPISGFINALRPSNMARPLLRAATLGLNVEAVSLGSAPAQVRGIPRFSRVFFSPSVVDGMPTSVIRSLPAGSNSLFVFFDYENMTPETTYELRATIDGEPSAELSLSPVRWSGGERGMWYIGTSGQPLRNGIYDFTLVVNGIAEETKRLLVGGAAETVPTFSNIVFGVGDNAGNMLGNGFVLPTGNIASARFIYRNMTSGVQWTPIWYYNGIELFRSTDSWTLGEGGSTTIQVQATNGLQPGNYRLELYQGTDLSATADFVIAGAAQSAFPEVFINTHFATGRSSEDALQASPVNNLPAGVEDLYALFDWRQLAPGTIWTMRWSVDGDLFFEYTGPWVASDTGENFLTQLSAESGLPDGTYTMDLLVNRFQIATARVQIGIGQLPIDRFARAGGVQLRGHIQDGQTNEGIPGVSFILISADFSIEDFTWQQSQVYAMAVTDHNGDFRLDRPLDFGVPYSVMIAADGYLPIAADGFEVDESTPNPLELLIELTRG
jgi:S1-C subfamily serine protease